jgi:hypothetical protein
MKSGRPDRFAWQTPLLLWRECAHIAWESHVVIALRTAGLMGVLRQDMTEPARMVIEKTDAATEAIHAALSAASRGQRADRIMAAALRPYRRRTRANLRRLSRKA